MGQEKATHYKHIMPSINVPGSTVTCVLMTLEPRNTMYVMGHSNELTIITNVPEIVVALEGRIFGLPVCVLHCQ